MATSLYLRREDEDLLDEIREKDPNFNFSEYIRDCIKKHSNKDKTISQAELNVEVEECNLIIKQQEAKIEKLKADLLKLDREEEEIKQAGLDVKEKEENRITEKRENFLGWYKDLGFNVPKEFEKELSEEYAKSDIRIIADYLELKGYKRAKENEL